MFIVVDGSQVNGERTGFASDGAATRTYNLGTRPLTPDPERLCSEEPMMNGLQEVAAHTKEILNRSVHRKKALRLRSRFKALHLALALPDWLVGGFSATVGVSVKPRCKPPGKERSGRPGSATTLVYPTRQRERQMRRFTSAIHPAQRFASVHGVMQYLFRVGRHLLRSRHHRVLRRQAFVEWDAATCAC